VNRTHRAVRHAYTGKFTSDFTLQHRLQAVLHLHLNAPVLAFHGDGGQLRRRCCKVKSLVKLASVCMSHCAVEFDSRLPRHEYHICHLHYMRWARVVSIRVLDRTKTARSISQYDKQLHLSGDPKVILVYVVLSTPSTRM